ncbi:MAG: hypothetical protein ABWZ79_19245 [Pedobacter agri]
MLTNSKADSLLERIKQQQLLVMQLLFMISDDKMYLLGIKTFRHCEEERRGNLSVYVTHPIRKLLKPICHPELLEGQTHHQSPPSLRGGTTRQSLLYRIRPIRKSLQPICHPELVEGQTLHQNPLRHGEEKRRGICSFT